jgi:hypothetical protein
MTGNASLDAPATLVPKMHRALFMRNVPAAVIPAEALATARKDAAAR